ncbi:MAG TPA: hypothetical protein DEV93_13655 [Chloroflexi bacterium]|jgi:O-antigen/teichoic acid export membrane protein|nr:hypothetical protein [Chloroflexota bacterium]
MSLLRKTARSAAWTFAGFQFGGVLTLGSSIVIARLLDPSALGRYALAATIVAIVTSGASLQMNGYYVVAEKATARVLRTGLLLELGLGGLLFIVLTGAALSYGLLAQDWAMTGYLVVAGGVLLTNPFGALGAFFTRNLQFRMLTIAQSCCLILSLTVKVALVSAGIGVWGLVIGDLTLSAAFAVAMLILVPAGRGLVWDRLLMRKQFSFGAPLLTTGLLGTMTLRGQDLVVAALLGTRSLGFYYLATRLANQAYQLGRALSVPLLPAFSRSSDSQLAQGFALTTRFSAFLVALPLALAVPLAGPFVVAVYGERWHPAALPLTLLFAAVAVRFVLWHAGNLLKSRGRVREIMWLAVVQLILTTIACSIGAWLLGVTGVAAGVLAVELALVEPKRRLIRSVVPFRIRDVLRSPAVALVLGTVVAAATARILPAPGVLFAAALSVVAVFAAIAWLTDSRSVSLIVSAFRGVQP